MTESPQESKPEMGTPQATQLAWLLQPQAPGTTSININELVDAAKSPEVLRAMAHVIEEMTATRPEKPAPVCTILHVCGVLDPNIPCPNLTQCGNYFTQPPPPCPSLA